MIIIIPPDCSERSNEELSVFDLAYVWANDAMR